jgi:dUTPase
MTIPFRIKLLTSTAKPPHRNCESDLWDLYADDFCFKNITNVKECDKVKGLIKYDNGVIGYDYAWQEENSIKLFSKSRILVKTGISLELPKKYVGYSNGINSQWLYDESSCELHEDNWELEAYAVADIRSRSGLTLKHGIEVLNSPGTIDNSYRKEIGVILYNAGHEPYTITKGDKIAQMLIRPLYPSKMEIVKDIEDTGRGGYGSTGK